MKKKFIYNDYGSNSIRKDFFLSLLNSKDEAFNIREDYNGVYFSVLDLRMLLGERKFKDRLNELLSERYISSIISPTRKSKYGKQLYFITPNKVESKMVSTVSDVGFISRYYNTKYEKIKGDDLLYQYETLKNTMFDLSSISFESISTDSIDYYNSTITRLNRFNTSSDIEKVIYLSKDSFSGRVHSIVTNIPKQYREVIIISKQPTFEVDLKQAQIVIFSEILIDSIGENSFSDLVIAGKDIYLFIQERFGLKSREEAKDYTFSMLFGRPDSKKAEQLYCLFPDIKDFIIKLKTNKLVGNTRAYHTNLAYLLQTYEVELFGKIWCALQSHKIKYLSVHDSIISNDNKALEIVESQLKENLSINPILTVKNK